MERIKSGMGEKREMNMARIRGWIVLAMDVLTIFACNILIFLPAYLRDDIRLLNLILHIGFLTACVLVFQVVFKTYESLWRYAESREYLCLLSGLTAGFALYAVLNLLLDLRQQFGLTYLFISHDLNVVSYVSDRIGVMYLGNLVELGDGEAISQMPLHPYTEALFSASMEVEGDRDRIILSGDLPSPAHPPAGCPFHTRCFACEERCKTEKPQLREFEGGRFCACHLVEKRTGKKPVAHNEALEGNV